MFSLTSELFSDLPPPLVQTDTPVSFNPCLVGLTHEKTIMWEVTNSQGSIITESGIILISGEYQTTITTFLRTLTNWKAILNTLKLGRLPIVMVLL